MNFDPSIFKDYDIRGTYPDQINKEIVTAITNAVVRRFNPKSVVVGRDMRLSGQEIRDAFVNTFSSLGIDVYDMGLVGTEMMSFMAGTSPHDLVIMISASHNPPEFNGFKMSLIGAVPVNSDTGFNDVRDLIKDGPLPASSKPGIVENIDVYPDWKKMVLSLVNPTEIKPLSVVVDAGNGMSGKLIPYVFKDLNVKLTPLYFDLDGSFPNHTPNPLIYENNKSLIDKVLEIKADLGLTFDGDGDRMFMVDNKGRFVSGTITTALFAKYFLELYPGETILYNAICGRIVPQTISKYGGKSKRVRVGYSYIKTAMKEMNAIFCGEHSGHYFHRSYFNSESGVLSSLIMLSLISKSSKNLSELVDELDIYFSSGEINFIVSDIQHATDEIKDGFYDADSIDELDGISVWYPNYWFNVRASKTEPLLRLNIEADNKEVLDLKTQELILKIESMGGKIK